MKRTVTSLRIGSVIVTFAATVAFSSKASAIAPVIFSYYPIAAPGCATSLASWWNGDTWITGCGSSGDNMVYELMRDGTERFEARGLNAKQVVIDPSSVRVQGYAKVWAVTAAGAVYEHYQPSGWVQYSLAPACTRWLSIALDKSWIIKCDNTLQYSLDSGTFVPIGGAPPGTLAQVAAPPRGGNPWLITSTGDIYLFDGSYHRQPGCATSIAIGWDGVPWVTGCSNADGNLYRWNGIEFSQVTWNQPLNFKSISISYENIPWGIGDGTTNPLGAIVERTAELDTKNVNVPQMDSNWCWAASGQSVYNYLSNGVNLDWQQCSLVNGVLGRSDCCNASRPCNQPGLETDMLSYLGVRYAEIPGAESWESLLANLSLNSPVLPAYFPSSGVGHSEVVEGAYAYAGAQYVERWNPEPVGVGTWETVSYVDFVSPPGYSTDWTIDAMSL